MANGNGPTGEWSEYEKLVLTELKACKKRLTALENGQTTILVDLATFKARVYATSTTIAFIVSIGVALIARLL